MSDILIKGIKMPKNCKECFACKAELSQEKKVIYVCCFAQTDCPLVPIPPHGRLIDADSKTFPTPHRNPSNDYMKGWNACLRSVQQQPTIIPEEEGE